LTVQRLAQCALLGCSAFVLFGLAAISYAVGSTNRAAGYLLIGASLCFAIAWLKDRWLNEERQQRER
jgi:hypothetical protein